MIEGSSRALSSLLTVRRRGDLLNASCLEAPFKRPRLSAFRCISLARSSEETRTVRTGALGRFRDAHTPAKWKVMESPAIKAFLVRVLSSI